MSVFIEVVSLEFLQNIPLFVGFVVAVRLWKRDWRWSLAVLMACVMGTTLLIHYTEGLIARIAGTIFEPTAGDFWISLIIFLIGGLISLVYFAILTPEIDWQLDLLFAIILGSILTLIQSTMLPLWSSVLGHFVGMTLGILLALLTFRYVIRLPRWTLAIGASTIVTLLVSVVITLIDYGPYLAG